MGYAYGYFEAPPVTFSRDRAASPATIGGNDTPICAVCIRPNGLGKYIVEFSLVYAHKGCLPCNVQARDVTGLPIDGVTR